MKQRSLFNKARSKFPNIKTKSFTKYIKDRTDIRSPRTDMRTVQSNLELNLHSNIRQKAEESYQRLDPKIAEVQVSNYVRCI